MSHGGLPGRRPDQYHEPSPRSLTAGTRIQRLGGTPQSQGTTSGAQVATVFYTFTAASRITAAEISFATASNASYTGGPQQLYARVTANTAKFGIINLGNVQLALSGPTQTANGQGGIAAPDAGIPVAVGDTLLLDVNNNVSPGTGGTGGSMRAECSVLFLTP